MWHGATMLKKQSTAGFYSSGQEAKNGNPCGYLGRYYVTDNFENSSTSPSEKSLFSSSHNQSLACVGGQMNHWLMRASGQRLCLSPLSVTGHRF